MMDRAVVVSPHLDDAALSCGGGITRLVHAQIPVTVVTVFTADQPAGHPLSRLARRSHASWGAGDQPFSARRDEDSAGLELLGVRSQHLGLHDAIYRRSDGGNALYSDPLTPPAAEDLERFLPALADALRAPLSVASRETRILCPAGTGGHVDHRLVRQAVELIADADSIVYYDEYPYSARPGVSSETSDGATGWPLSLLALTAEEVEARIAAARCYGSQLRGLFPTRDERVREILSARIPVVGSWFVRPLDPDASGDRMAAQVRRDLASAGGERYWWSPRQEPPFPSA
jgi:LmbE family N-acetylglucosaminyl deacetylase